MKSDKYLEERIGQSIKLSIDILNNKCLRSINVGDLGCGNLKATNLVHSKLKNGFNIVSYHLVDIQLGDFKPYLESYFRVHQHDLNLGKLDIQTASLDFVYALETIEHLYSPDTFIQEISRVLKKGGILTLTTPNMLAWYNRILFPLGVMPIHYEVSNVKNYGRRFRVFGQGKTTVGHIRTQSLSSLKELLKDHKFRILHIKGLQFIFQGPFSLVDKLFTLAPSFASTFLIICEKMNQ